MSELSDVLEEERQAALVAAQPPVMVYVRVRPLLEHELRKGSKYVWEQNASNTTLRMKKSSSAWILLSTLIYSYQQRRSSNGRRLQ